MNAHHVNEQAAMLRDEGHDALPAVCDIRDPVAVKALRDMASSRGPLRVLAHVVGLSPSMADWKTVMNVDLVGAKRVADAMLPLAGQGTAAIFISSMAAYVSTPDNDTMAVLDDPLSPDFIENLERRLGNTATSSLAYILAKFALNRMCARDAAAWGKKGARIISLSPGMIATPLGRLEWQHQPRKYDILAKTPLQREGTLVEIADAVEFLASDRASFISGIDLLVDGGATAAIRHGA
jgi:NAD(P)-dependent dehydrogenase (short-subunit alcohol dehydrogenase family)